MDGNRNACNLYELSCHSHEVHNNFGGPIGRSPLPRYASDVYSLFKLRNNEWTLYRWARSRLMNKKQFKRILFLTRQSSLSADKNKKTSSCRKQMSQCINHLTNMWKTNKQHIEQNYTAFYNHRGCSDSERHTSCSRWCWCPHCNLQHHQSFTIYQSQILAVGPVACASECNTIKLGTQMTVLG